MNNKFININNLYLLIYNMNNFKTLRDLLNNIITYNNILNSLDNNKDYNIKGNIYEKLFKICFLFNIFDNYNLLDKNFKEINNKEKYLNNNILDSNIEGKIDIKLKHNNKDKYIFFSCKYFDKEKDLDNYDIDKIKTYLDNLKIYDNHYTLGLLIKNKEQFLKKYNNSHNDTLKNLINLNYVYDLNDLYDWLNYINENFSFDWLKNLNKQHLKLYDYQQQLINQIDNNKNILLGACPRTGKTYIIAGYINQNKEKLKNILIITSCPKETLEQWNEIYENYFEFIDYNIFKIETSKELINLEFKEKNIIIISKQLLQLNYKNFNFEPNLLIFDEHDFHGTSDLSKDIIKKYSKISQNIYLTGTYYKSLYNIKNPTIIKYDYYDLHKDNPNTPEQIYLTTRFNENTFKNILKYNLEFNFNILFKLDENNRFEYEEKVKDFINYYISNNTPESIKYRIDKLYKIYKQEDNKYTQLWFLPENNIDIISKNLVKILVKNNYYRNFDILTFNSKNYYLYETEYNNVEEDYKTNEIKLSKNINIKDFIKKQELKIKLNSNKKGLLILVGGMLNRGISLNHINTIFFLNESESYAKYLQSTYRCLTEEKDKKIGIIVDFNINRILSLFINYNNRDERINNLNIDDKIKYMIENNFINLDTDKLKTFEFDGQKSLQNILDLWNKNPINQLNIFKKLIEETYENLDLNINYEILKIFKNIDEKDLKQINKNINEKYELVNDENIDKQRIPKNNSKKEKIKVNKDEIENIKNELIEKKKLTKDILPYIIPLSCILTYDNNEKQFINILNIIKNNKILKEIFNNQCETIWDKNGLLDIFIQIIEKLDNLENINNYISKIKYNINKLLDNPEELTKFINECLTIKHCEREKNGEVLTPAWLINQMLDKLEEYDKDIFKKKIKYFDHSCGNGGFMIELYKRLIKYHKKEKILNEMIYISEYNKKNVFLLKIIFGKNSNINEGDTLTLDIKEKWNIDKFDVILGNPPYNSGGIKSCSGKKLSKTEKNITIWPDFINYSINNLKENGYLISINPLSWMKNTHSLFNKLTNKNILWLKLTSSSESNKMINACIPLSCFIIQNCKYKNKTEIIRNNYKEITKLNNNYSLPLGYFNIFNKLNKFINENNLKLEYFNKVVKGEDKKYIINDINNININDNYGIDTYTLKDGYVYKKMIKKHIDTDKRKLIICNKRSFKGCFIDNGNIGLVGTDKFYILGNNLELLLKIFNFKFINLITEFTKYRQDFINNEVFNFIPDIRKLNIKDITEEKLYKLLNLTEDEINIINNF